MCDKINESFNLDDSSDDNFTKFAKALLKILKTILESIEPKY
jgi:hypothetical protein